MMLVRRRLMREQRVPDVVVLVTVLVPGALHELHEQFPVAHLLVLLLPRGSPALAFLSLYDAWRQHHPHRHRHRRRLMRD
jgi:hypothetical protein